MYLAQIRTTTTLSASDPETSLVCILPRTLVARFHQGVGLPFNQFTIFSALLACAFPRLPLSGGKQNYEYGLIMDLAADRVPCTKACADFCILERSALALA